MRRHRPLALALALLLCSACVGPIGRIGLDREVIQALAADQAAWCITVDWAQLFLIVSMIRVSYWRDNAIMRPPTAIRDCADARLLPGMPKGERP